MNLTKYLLLLLAVFILNCSDETPVSNDKDSETTDPITKEEKEDTTTIIQEKEKENILNNWSDVEGEGSRDNPYEIKELWQLDSVRHHPNDHFILMNDLDFAEKNSDSSWISIPTFSGSINGMGYEIKNLQSFNNEERAVKGIGLIETLEETGRLIAIALTEVSLHGNAFAAAPLVCFSYGYVRDCYSTGDINANAVAAGLISQNYGTITNCYSNCDIVANSAGGLVAANITNYDNEMDSTIITLGHIDSSYATGSVTAKFDAAGFVSYNEGDIYQCYSKGDVHGGEQAGGFVAVSSWGAKITNRSTMYQCYTTSNVSGGQIAGFVNSVSYADVSDCYAMGTLESDGLVSAFVTNILSFNFKNCYSVSKDVEGNFVNFRHDGKLTTTNCYSLSAEADTAFYFDVHIAHIRLPAEELKKEATYTGVEWDFDFIWTIDAHKNNGYPYFRWQNL